LQNFFDAWFFLAHNEPTQTIILHSLLFCFVLALSKRKRTSFATLKGVV